MRPRERRRQRPTSSGTPPTDFISYHASRTPSQDTSARHGRVQRERNSSLRRKALRIVCLVILALGAVYSQLLTSSPKLLRLASASDQSIFRQDKAYIDAAEQILAGSVLNRTKLTINESGFEAEMKRRFFELDQVSLTLPLLGRRPVVEIIPKKPLLALVAQQTVYVIDGTGAALMRAQDLVDYDGLGLPTVIDESTVAVEPGTGVLTRQQVTFISILLAQLKAGQLTIDTVTLPTVPNELKVRLKNERFDGLFDMQNDPRLSAGAYMAIRSRLEQDKQLPASYIDVRLDDRAYYK